MVLHKVTSDQSNLLRDLSHVAYSLNFGNHWEGEGLALYLKDQFGPARLSSDLSGPEILYFFIRKGTENAGFMKINTDFNRQRVSVCFRKMNNSQNTFVFFILLPKSLEISFACVSEKHAHCSALLFCLCVTHLSQLAIKVIEIYYCNVYSLCPLKSSKTRVHENTAEYYLVLAIVCQFASCT